MLIEEDASELEDMVEIVFADDNSESQSPSARVKKSPTAAEFDESKVTRDEDGKFGSGGGGGSKKTATSANLNLPQPQMQISALSAKRMADMIAMDIKQGMSLEDSLKQYDDGGWDYLTFNGKKKAINAVEKSLANHDKKHGLEQGTTDEIDGQHWEDWISDNYTGPVEDKLISDFKNQMRAKFGAST